jgi:hypothetical protein
MLTPQAGRRLRFLPDALLIVGSLLLFAPSLPWLFSDYLGSPACDMNIAYRHYLRFATRWLHQGVIPQWNPHIFCGTAFLPSTCATLHHPLNAALLYLFPLPFAANLAIIAHTLIFALGVAWWGRLTGLGRWHAAFAGIMAVASGALVPRIFAGHFTIVSTFSAAPWFLSACHATARRQTGWVSASLWGALMLLGGHLQMAYYGFMLAGVVVIAAGLETPGRFPAARLGKQLLIYAGVVALAMAVAGLEMLPVADVLRDSARLASPDTSWVRRFSLPPENLLLLLFPDALGQPLTYMGRWFWWEASPYCGVTIIMLLAVFIAAGRGALRSVAVPLAVLAVATLLAVAPAVPVLDRLAMLIPGWTALRGHAKIFMFALVAAALLAAHGLQALGARNQRAWIALRVAALVVGLAALAAAGGLFDAAIMPYASSNDVLASRLSGPDPATPQGVAVLKSSLAGAATHTLVICAVLVALSFAGPWLSGPKGQLLLALTCVAELALLALPVCNAHFRPDDPRALWTVAAHLRETRDYGRVELLPTGLVNAAMTPALSTPGGNDVNISAAYNTFLSAVEGRFGGQPHLHVQVQGESPLWDYAALKYILIPQEAAMQDNLPLEKAFEAGNLVAWRRKTALPYAAIFPAARWVADDERAIFAQLTGSDFAQRHEWALLAGKPQPLPAAPQGAGVAGAEATRLSPTEIRVTAGKSGVLVVAEGFSRHWRAQDASGTKLPVYRANGAFLGVPVIRPGEVSLRYANPYFLWGRVVSVVAFLGIIGAVAGTELKRRRKAG